MHRINQNEFEAVHRIFNHVEDLIGPYYGKKTQAETENFVSENRWIMFPVNNVDNLREGTVYPLPNVYVSFDGDEIQDNGAGRVNGYIGINYHNVEAMQSLLKIIDPRRRSRHQPFLDILSRLNFSIAIERKTKTDCQHSTPRYDTFRSLDPSLLTTVQIRDAIMDSDRSLLRAGDPYPGTGNPVLWSVTIFSTYKVTTIAHFDRNIKKAFEAFQQLLTLAQ